MEELDISSYYMPIMAIGVALVALLVAVLPHLPHRKGGQETITNGDLLTEVKKLFQTLESKLQTLGATESVVNEVKAMRQDLESKFAELREHHAPSKIPENIPSGFDEKLDKALSGLDFLVTYFQIQKGVKDYASLIVGAYDNFKVGIDQEFELLEHGDIDGPEYFFRANMLLFSLMMAKVYMGLYSSDASLWKLEEYIERAKKLV